MPELQRPYLKCPTCGEMTALPYPNPEGKPSVHTEWPSATWKRNFLRLECDHACVYTKSNIHLRSVLQPGQSPLPHAPHVVCVQLPCANEACEARLKIHITVADWQPNQTASRHSVLMLVDAIQPSEFSADVQCSNGHPVGARGQPSVVPDPSWWN